MNLPLSRAGDEGFVIHSVMVEGRPTTVIAANRDVGALYGAFLELDDAPAPPEPAADDKGKSKAKSR